MMAIHMLFLRSAASRHPDAKKKGLRATNDKAIVSKSWNVFFAERGLLDGRSALQF